MSHMSHMYTQLADTAGSAYLLWLDWQLLHRALKSELATSQHNTTHCSLMNMGPGFLI